MTTAETAGSGNGESSPALLDAALEQLRLEGAIFFRSELTESFAFESAPLALADVLHPGATRLLLFHIVAEGTCWVAVDGGEPHWAEPGDVIVVPYGDRHTIGGCEPAETVSILSLLEPPPWDVMPVVRHGGDGPQTELVCGYLVSDDPLFDPALRAFPPAFVVRLPAGPASRWVQASIAYSIEEAVASNVSSNPMSTRLPELVLIEVLRAHLASAPAVDHGWIAALHDPVIAAALAQLHAEPARKWTVDRDGKRGQPRHLWRRGQLPPGVHEIAQLRRFGGIRREPRPAGGSTGRQEAGAGGVPVLPPRRRRVVRDADRRGRARWRRRGQPPRRDLAPAGHRRAHLRRDPRRAHRAREPDRADPRAANRARPPRDDEEPRRSPAPRRRPVPGDQRQPRPRRGRRRPAGRR